MDFRRRYRGFTLTELLIVIGVLLVLLAILLPAIGGARLRARDANCRSNLRQIGLAASLYAADFRLRYPMGGERLGSSGAFSGPYWDRVLYPYVTGEFFPADKLADNFRPLAVYQCPFDITATLRLPMNRTPGPGFSGSDDFTSYAVSFSNGVNLLARLRSQGSVRPQRMRQQARFEGNDLQNFDGSGPSGVVYLVDYHGSRRHGGERYTTQGRGHGHYGQNFNFSSTLEQFDCHHPSQWWGRAAANNQRAETQAIGPPNALFFDLAVNRIETPFAYRDARIWYASPF